MNGGAGTDGRGGGGGGQNQGLPYTGGNGGSGLVIIRYPIYHTKAIITGAGSYSEIGGNRVYTFTGLGSITF
jgi:hypothetical protein